MKQRGRKSANAIAEAILISADCPRITSPEKLTTEQAVVFGDIVESLPGKFFGQEQAHLVTQLCRHIVSARRLSVWIDKIERFQGDDFEPAEYLRALESRRKESAQITALCRALRLTNQSRFRPEKAADNSARPNQRPWEFT